MDVYVCRFCLRGPMFLEWNNIVLGDSILTWLMASGGLILLLTCTPLMDMGTMRASFKFLYAMPYCYFWLTFLVSFIFHQTAGRLLGIEGQLVTCHTIRCAYGMVFQIWWSSTFSYTSLRQHYTVIKYIYWSCMILAQFLEDIVFAFEFYVSDYILQQGQFVVYTWPTLYAVQCAVNTSRLFNCPVIPKFDYMTVDEIYIIISEIKWSILGYDVWHIRFKIIFLSLLTPAYMPFIRAGEIWLSVRTCQWMEFPIGAKLSFIEFVSNQAESWCNFLDFVFLSKGKVSSSVYSCNPASQCLLNEKYLSFC